MFGGSGIGNSFYQDLWKLTVSDDNKATWVNLTPATIPPTSWPPARSSSVAWTDNSGNKYLFGGRGIGNSYYQDLWKLTVSGNTATWVNLTPADPITVSWPPARVSSVAWTDNSGNKYLFGGIGIGNSFYQDLWKLTVSGNTATWVSLTPKSRQTWPSTITSAASWEDNLGNYYLFGGVDGFGYYYQDLWKLTISGDTATWVNLTPADPITVPWPSRRVASVTWKDKDGKIYLFGGDASNSPLNDLFMI